MGPLSFSIHVESGIDEDGVAYREGWCSATVGKTHIGSASLPVDVFSILNTEGLSSSFSLLTCTCGIAGCAGFFNDPKQVCTPKRVTWFLDAKEYGAALGTMGLVPDANSRLKLMFSVAAFSAALAELRTNLSALFKGGPVWFNPGDARFETMAELESALENGRAWVVADLERIALEKAAYGPLLDQKLVATFADGSTCTTTAYSALNSILRDEADNAGLHCRDEAQEYVLKQVQEVWRPCLAKSYSPLLTLMKKTPWENEASHWFLYSPATHSADDRLGGLEARWQQAVLTLA